MKALIAAKSSVLRTFLSLSTYSASESMSLSHD